MHYKEYGNKDNPTILLLHGAGALDTFCGQYSLSEKFHLIVPHLAGAGEAAAEIYEPEKTVNELIEFIKTYKKKVGVIGHSLGGQIAIMLVSRHPELFDFAVFLSADVIPNPKSIRMYCSFAGFFTKMLNCRWLISLQGKYWKYTKDQLTSMAAYSKLITPEVYRSFFVNTLDLSKLPEYQSVAIPMLAVCGSYEVGSIKKSLLLLASNPNCRTMILQGANHYFPMRKAWQVNPVLENFISGCLSAQRV